VEVDSVLVDNFSGGYQATRYLLSLGHRQIGCIAGPSQLTPSAQRLTGYRQALDEAGIPRDEGLIVAGDFESISGYRACRALLLSSNRPTAIFACNDLMAIGAMFAAHELGIGVSGELSIVGFDDISLCSFTIPRLTTIAQPKYEMGRMVTDMLVRRISDRSLAQRTEILQTKLIVRDSCAPLSKARRGKKSMLTSTAA
jgi:LacI family transcriptional regulator, galactose operon repressor